MDNPRGRPPYSNGGDRSGRGKSPHSNRVDDTRRDSYGPRDGGGPRFARRDPRPANPQSTSHRPVHYQVVTMDEEEWGDSLENRLNTLGHEGWRLIAIDEGRQYVFVQND